jgi:hypothetical protein
MCMYTQLIVVLSWVWHTYTHTYTHIYNWTGSSTRNWTEGVAHKYACAICTTTWTTSSWLFLTTMPGATLSLMLALPSVCRWWYSCSVLLSYNYYYIISVFTWLKDLFDTVHAARLSADLQKIVITVTVWLWLWLILSWTYSGESHFYNHTKLWISSFWLLCDSIVWRIMTDLPELILPEEWQHLFGCSCITITYDLPFYIDFYIDFSIILAVITRDVTVLFKSPLFGQVLSQCFAYFSKVLFNKSFSCYSVACYSLVTIIFVIILQYVPTNAVLAVFLVTGLVTVLFFSCFSVACYSLVTILQYVPTNAVLSSMPCSMFHSGVRSSYHSTIFRKKCCSVKHDL